MSANGSDAPTLGWLGSFQLLEKLPKRREVTEYVARQKGPGGFERICMIKTAKRAMPTTDARAAEALIREAKVMMRLDHPNIVRFHHFFEKKDDLILVCEHFSGLSLDRFVEHLRSDCGHVDERITWHVARSLFEALAHAHNLVDVSGEPAPIFHRDVRPANVLVASDGRVRLTGFAFAMDVDGDESTACGAMYTSPSYVAPEQVRGKEATDRSDAFAAALVVWELLTGRSATQDGLGDYDLLRHLSRRQMESLRVLRPDIPPLVTTALDLCLAPNPEERRIGCEEVAGCVRAGLEGGNGVEAIRDAIARMGPAVEKLAGGKAASPAASRRMASSPGAAHRPEALTLPDRVPLDAAVTVERPVRPIDMTPTAEIRVPQPPSSRTAASHPAPSSSPSALAPPPPPPSSRPASQPSPSSSPSALAPPPPSARAPSPSSAPAQALPPPSYAPSHSVDAEGLDDELQAMQAAGEKRRKLIRVVIAVPVLLTAGVVVMAMSGGQCSSSDETVPALSVPSREPTATATETVAPRPAASEHEEPRDVDAAAANEAPVPSNQAVLVVEAPPDGVVYLMGKPVGRTGQPIVTDCGQKFIRVGTTMGPSGLADVRWLAEGTSVMLRCGHRQVVKSQ